MPQSICGADFLPAAGDWGDPDLALALQKVLAPQENSTGTPDGQVGKHTPTPTAATRDAVSMLPKVHTECNTVPVLASRPVLRPAAAAKTVASEQPTVRGAVSSVVSPREASSSSTQNNTNTTHTPLSRSTQRNLPSKSPHLRVPLVLFGHMHERLCATGAHTAKYACCAVSAAGCLCVCLVAHTCNTCTRFPYTFYTPAWYTPVFYTPACYTGLACETWL